MINGVIKKVPAGILSQEDIIEYQKGTTTYRLQMKKSLYDCIVKDGDNEVFRTYKQTKNSVNRNAPEKLGT